ncbi:MAG TPA: hypothetical protein DEB06_09425 [Phycisphaerales bacterium]|nr:hypothetical protein [Phycisphaerales bacterium]
MNYCAFSRFHIAGTVCFDADLHTFNCQDELRLDKTLSALFQRIDRLCKSIYPGEQALLVFDDRDPKVNTRNAKAITNYLIRSSVGRTFDSMIPYPVFAVSQAHNYGLQAADVIATVCALKFQGRLEADPLWHIVNRMIHRFSDGEHRSSTLKVIRNVE